MTQSGVLLQLPGVTNKKNPIYDLIFFKKHRHIKSDIKNNLGVNEIKSVEIMVGKQSEEIKYWAKSNG